MEANCLIHYECFYSDKAYELIEWCVTVKDRIKASKIYNAACNMEDAFRKSSNINYSGNGIKYVKGRSLTTAKFLVGPPPIPRSKLLKK